MDGDTTEYLSESELATTIRLTPFLIPDRPGWGEGDFTLSSLAGLTSDEVAHALFQTALARREEAAKWITGALYIDGEPSPSMLVYQRETSGWRITGTPDRFRDGELDTDQFRRLIPEASDDLAGEFERLAQRLGHDVRGTAYSHARGWYRDCPACKAAAAASAEHRVRATEADHRWTS